MKKDWSLATHTVHSKDWSDWADALADQSLLGTQVILLVLSEKLGTENQSFDTIRIEWLLQAQNLN